MDSIHIMDSDGYDRALSASNNRLIKSGSPIFLTFTDEYDVSRHINLDEAGVTKLYNWLGRWIRENVKVEFVG